MLPNSQVPAYPLSSLCISQHTQEHTWSLPFFVFLPSWYNETSPMVPNWDLITTSEEEDGGDSNQPAPTLVDFAVSPEIHFPELSSWNQISFPPFDSSADADDYYSNIFNALSDVELHLNLPQEQNSDTFAVTSEPSCLALDGGNSSSGSKGKSIVSEDRVPKIYGEKRRDRINEKIRTLQELIPNCNKSDRASVLDGVIQYLKALKLQVEMMSMRGGSLLKAPYVSPASVQSVHPPQFSPFMPMSLSIDTGSGLGIGFGMGMMCYHPMGTSLIAVPSQSPCSLVATAASLPQMPRSGVAPITPLVPMKYMPFTVLTSTPAIVTPSISPESPALKLFQDGNSSNQAGCSSQWMQISVNDVQKFQELARFISKWNIFN